MTPEAMKMLEPDTITVELHNGTTYKYSAHASADDVVNDLKAKGVRKGDIKNTIHVIPRLPHAMAYKIE